MDKNEQSPNFMAFRQKSSEKNILSSNQSNHSGVVQSSSPSLVEATAIYSLAL